MGAGELDKVVRRVAIQRGPPGITKSDCFQRSSAHIDTLSTRNLYITVRRTALKIDSEAGGNSRAECMAFPQQRVAIANPRKPL
jgi:hypothetical protein